MSLQDEADAWLDRYREQRALRPKKFRTDRPRCVQCSAGLEYYEMGERDCWRCREKAARITRDSEARRRLCRDPLVIVDW